MRSILQFLLIAPTLACLLGCNLPTSNPVSADTSSSGCSMAEPSAPLKSSSPIVPDSIPLEGALKVSGISSPLLAFIQGSVTYSLMSTCYRGVFRINIDLSTVASIAPEGTGTTVWHVEGKSHDQLFLLHEGSIILRKNYAVVGSENQMMLWLPFVLTPKGIGLKEMQLEIQRLAGRNRQPFPMLNY